MLLPFTPPWTLDPKAPQAPSQADWDALPASEQRRLAEALFLAPHEELDAMAPEGTRHDDEVSAATDRLRQWFGAGRRQAFVARNMRVFYPGVAPFDPDVLVVLDVPQTDRDTWIVSNEGGRGLDVVIEVLWRGNRTKDLGTNVDRFARLGIAEYYVVDLPRARLHAHHLPAQGGPYRLIEPVAGRVSSPLLDLDLMFDGRTLRLIHGISPILSPSEAYGQLQVAMAGLSSVIEASEARADAEKANAAAEKANAAAERANADAEKARADAERANADAERLNAAAEKARADELERRLAALLAERGS